MGPISYLNWPVSKKNLFSMWPASQKELFIRVLEWPKSFWSGSAMKMIKHTRALLLTTTSKVFSQNFNYHLSLSASRTLTWKNWQLWKTSINFLLNLLTSLIIKSLCSLTILYSRKVIFFFACEHYFQATDIYIWFSEVLGFHQCFWVERAHLLKMFFTIN